MNNASCHPPAPPATHSRRSTPLAPEGMPGYLGLIKRNALRLARRLPSHVQVDDLIGAGHVGLVNAARRYDPSNGARFETFAEHHIRGAMLDAVRSVDPLSRDVRRQARTITRATHELRALLGREPEEAEIAQAAEIPVDRLRFVQTQVATAVETSLDAPRGGEDRPSLGPPAPVESDPAGRAETRELSEHLRAALDELPERLQTVVSLYYGEGCTLKQIGERLGFTESRACQLHGEAIHRLRTRFGSMT